MPYVRFETKPKKDIWAGKYNCPRCGTIQNHHLYRIKDSASVYLIPIISMTKKRGIACDNCQAFHELQKDEYKKIESTQLQLFNQKKFPADIVAQDYNPKSLHMAGRTLLLILMILYSFVMFLSAIAMLTDVGFFDISVFFFFLFMLALAFLPLIFAARSHKKAKQKKALYNFLCNNAADANNQ